MCVCSSYKKFFSFFNGVMVVGMYYQSKEIFNTYLTKLLCIRREYRLIVCVCVCVVLTKLCIFSCHFISNFIKHILLLPHLYLKPPFFHRRQKNNKTPNGTEKSSGEHFLIVF